MHVGCTLYWVINWLQQYSSNMNCSSGGSSRSRPQGLFLWLQMYEERWQLLLAVALSYAAESDASVHAEEEGRGI